MLKAELRTAPEEHRKSNFFSSSPWITTLAVVPSQAGLDKCKLSRHQVRADGALAAPVWIAMKALCHPNFTLRHLIHVED